MRADPGGGLLRAQLEARARQLEGKELGQASAQVRGKPDTPRYDRDRQGASAAVVAAPKAYNADADITADVKPEAVKEKKKVCSELLGRLNYQRLNLSPERRNRTQSQGSGGA